MKRQERERGGKCWRWAKRRKEKKMVSADESNVASKPRRGHSSGKVPKASRGNICSLDAASFSLEARAVSRDALE